ncbi:MAG: acyl-CoA desaturase [Candidatus Dadabacteria bacterium]|nr:MAG: acyl-CoA desaturase [Candidatus Dadabacteria bacterium]
MSTQVQFPVRSGFYKTLRQRVRSELEQAGLSERDAWQMYAKTAFIVTLATVSYIQLVFVASTLTEALIWGFLLAQSHVMIGFDVMHDGGHGAYSRHRWVNAFMGHLLDLIGGNQRLWHFKHNIRHHTYTNIDGLDEDLETGGILRLSPGQPRKWWHRAQAWYAFPVYALLSLYWVFFSDFKEYLTRRVGQLPIDPPTMKDRLIFWGGKAFYFGYALVLPSFFHPFTHVLAAFVGIHVVLGFSLALVFQLAHTVEETDFPEPDAGAMPDEWAVHQLRTTADFARHNPLVSFYVGGLNFQVEHHLFSKICHVRYPRISRVVKETCQEYGVPYHESPSVLAAIRSHLRFLHTLGQPERA